MSMSMRQLARIFTTPSLGYVTVHYNMLRYVELPSNLTSACDNSSLLSSGPIIVVIVPFIRLISFNCNFIGSSFDGPKYDNTGDGDNIDDNVLDEILLVELP